jgi:hypothetical protein
VWPFDEFALPLVVEIYPRVLTGEVIKSSHEARAEFLANFGQRDDAVDNEITATEHPFDAAISALVMNRHLDQLEQLRKEAAPYALEGEIWAPTLGAGSGQVTEHSMRAIRSGSPRRSTAWPPAKSPSGSPSSRRCYRTLTKPRCTRRPSDS